MNYQLKRLIKQQQRIFLLPVHRNRSAQLFWMNRVKKQKSAHIPNKSQVQLQMEILQLQWQRIAAMDMFPMEVLVCWPMVVPIQVNFIYFNMNIIKISLLNCFWKKRKLKWIFKSIRNRILSLFVRVCLCIQIVCVFLVSLHIICWNMKKKQFKIKSLWKKNPFSLQSFRMHFLLISSITICLSRLPCYSSDSNVFSVRDDERLIISLNEASFFTYSNSIWLIKIIKKKKRKRQFYLSTSLCEESTARIQRTITLWFLSRFLNVLVQWRWGRVLMTYFTNATTITYTRRFLIVYLTVAFSRSHVTSDMVSFDN